MAKKRIAKKDVMDKSRLLDDIKTAKPGEYCYFIDRSKKIWWGLIEKVYEESDQLIFQILEERETKYHTVSAENCAFSEKLVKEIKGGK